MKVLAINNGHNATAAIFTDGECVCYYHEEKFNNIKNFTGIPFLALQEINKKYSLSDIDYCVFAFTEQIISQGNDVGALETLGNSNLRSLYNFLEYKTGWKQLFSIIRDVSVNHFMVPSAQKKIKKVMFDQYNIPEEKILFSDHHLNHCLSPLFFYGLTKKDSLLVSLDGTGDGYCGRVFVYKAKSGKLKEITKIRYENSIGILYRELTAFLGMKRLEHEYKVMGLAAYVNDRKYFNDIYEVFQSALKVNKKLLTFESKFNMNVSLLYLKEKLQEKRFDNIAAALQAFTEDFVITWMKEVIKKTNIRTVCLSGGVFMNVKLNKRIVEMKETERVYIQPSCGDDSLSIGAAASIFRQNKIDLTPMKTMYLGTEYSNKEIDQFLRKNNIFSRYKVTYHKNIEKEIARLVSNFQIVPRFTAKGEWGARSLCNRAILANASNLKSFYEVNDQVKMRDFWMPFAPTILEDWADRYIKNWKLYKHKAFDSTKYMILSFDTTELAQQHLKAALHQKDKTIRPQIVEQQDNVSLHKLLKYYEQFTGMGGLLNTSLNIHGYPLVNTLEQALFTFKNSGLRYMNLENYLIEKA